MYSHLMSRQEKDEFELEDEDEEDGEDEDDEAAADARREAEAVPVSELELEQLSRDGKKELVGTSAQDCRLECLERIVRHLSHLTRLVLLGLTVASNASCVHRPTRAPSPSRNLILTAQLVCHV